MAGKNIDKFFKEAQSSLDFQARFEALKVSYGNDMMKVTVELAREMGYDFTEAQLQTAMEKKSADMVAQGPLSDEEMESVAAAGSDGLQWCWCTRYTGHH